MENGHPPSCVEYVSDHIRAGRIFEVVIDVGARAGYHERQPAPERQTHGERARPVGVERVDQCRNICLDLSRDRGLVAGREVPHGELDPATLERARDARHCHGVAAWGGWAERGEDRHAGGHWPEHTGADAARKGRTRAESESLAWPRASTYNVGRCRNLEPLTPPRSSVGRSPTS